MSQFIVKKLLSVLSAGLLIVSLSACGLFSPGRPTAPETVPVSTTEEPTIEPPSSPCPAGITLPAGIDEDLICGPAPDSTVVLPGYQSMVMGQEWFGFRSADKKIGCAWNDTGTISCTVAKFVGQFPHDPEIDGCDIGAHEGLWLGDDGVGSGICNGGVIELDVVLQAKSPVLESGEIVLSTDYPYPWDWDEPPTNQVACLAANDGIICWDTVSAHGFKINQDQAVYW